MPIHFNKPVNLSLDRPVAGVDSSPTQPNEQVQSKAPDAVTQTEPAADMPGADVRAVVGDTDNHASRPERRSAGARAGVAGLSQVMPKLGSGKSMLAKAVTAALIGVVALNFVGTGPSNMSDPGPPGDNVRVEQPYEQVGNGLEGRPARGTPMQIQMENMGGGEREVRSDSVDTQQPAPQQRANESIDQGATPGSAQIQGETSRHIDVEVRTGYVNQDKQAGLGLGSARTQRQQAAVDADVGQQSSGVEMGQQDLTDAERLDLENRGGTRRVRTQGASSQGVQRTGGVTFHNSGGGR